MSEHKSISPPREAADRLAIRELVEATPANWKRVHRS